MIRCETIVWYPYPEETPDIPKHYIVLTTTDCIKAYWNGFNWYDDYHSYINSEQPINKSIIAFVERLEGYDPEAKTFNFQTALELMKHNRKLKCISMVTKRLIYMEGDRFQSDYPNTSKVRLKLSGAEILGKWKLAEEQE